MSHCSPCIYFVCIALDAADEVRVGLVERLHERLQGQLELTRHCVRQLAPATALHEHGGITAFFSQCLLLLKKMQYFL